MKRLIAFAALALFSADRADAACAVTNTFSASTTAVASQVNQDFTDLKNCIEALQARDTIPEIESADGINVILATEVDTSAELRGLLGDAVGTGAAYFVGGALGTPASGTATNLTGTAAGLTAGAATALAANGSNCSAGNFPLGVDASGASENCTDAATQTELDAKSLASSTDNQVTRFDGTTGDLQGSGCTIDDSGNQACTGSIQTGGSAIGCLIIRDTDNAGDTEVRYLNGTASTNIDTDGLCNGS